MRRLLIIPSGMRRLLIKENTFCHYGQTTHTGPRVNPGTRVNTTAPTHNVAHRNARHVRYQPLLFSVIVWSFRNAVFTNESNPRGVVCAYYKRKPLRYNVC